MQARVPVFVTSPFLLIIYIPLAYVLLLDAYAALTGSKIMRAVVSGDVDTIACLYLSLIFPPDDLNIDGMEADIRFAQVS